MKVEEVPQHQRDFKDGNSAPKRVVYATHKDGTYTQATSNGWEVENIALQQVWEDIDNQLLEVKQNILQGKSSPIAYYMIKERMDIGILSAYVGKWQWQVRRHLKASVFSKLSMSILARYAKIFNITVDQLKKLD